MIPKLVLITEIIAPYRIPVFNALALRTEIDLHVIFLAENDPSLRQWRVYKSEIKFQYQVLTSWRRRIGRYNVLINPGVLKALNTIGPDVVMCGGYNYLASWEAGYWASWHRVPLLLWSESTGLDRRRGHRLVELMKARFLTLCQAFVVPGISAMQYLKSLGIPEERIHTAPNAVDTGLFAGLAEDARQTESQKHIGHPLPLRYFLYVGRLVQGKGVFDLLEAYARLDPAIRASVGLVFVGDGVDASDLQARASQVTPGMIHFAGFVHREDLPEFYAKADALIFPTHSDTWGLVVNEAMSCGLPVIASSVAGCVADLVRDCWNGYVVISGDPSQLAAAMSRIAVNPRMRKEMAARSRERIKSYSPAAWAEGMVRAVGWVFTGGQ